MHYQDPQWFAQALEPSLGRHDWYILFPHFPLNPVTSRKIGGLIAQIPQQKLICLDHLPPYVEHSCGAVFQSIEEDVVSSLESVIFDVQKYSRLIFIPLSVSLYGVCVAEAIQGFGSKNNVPTEVLQDIPEKIERGDLFFVSGSRLDWKLSRLLEKISASGMIPGKEVGLICYNEFPLNEFIFGGLTTLSVDFDEMGRIAGEMILSGTLSRIQCKATLTRRNTF